MSMQVVKRIVEEEYDIPKANTDIYSQIIIQKHNIIYKHEDGKCVGTGVTIRIKNVSGADVGIAILEVILYDIKGNIIESIEENMRDFEKDGVHILDIKPSIAKDFDIRDCSIKLKKVVVTPSPVAVGNEDVIIMNHSLERDEDFQGHVSYKINLAIRNISEKTIATALFNVIFYDSEGNILDIIRHKEFEIKQSTSRAVFIDIVDGIGMLVKSYNVSILKVITSDVEKVHLCRSGIRKTKDNEEEIIGSLKNISDIKTDVALIATLKDCIDERIGVKVVLIKDIEPNTIRKFHFILNVPEGETVKSYSLYIGEVLENIEGIE